MWWHNFLPSATIFQIGEISIRWYGLILVLAMVTASFYAARIFFQRQLLSWSKFEDLVFYLIIFSLVGARLGHILYTWPYYSQHLVDTVKIWQGGISIQGAILFGVVTLAWWCKKNGFKFYDLSDVLVVALVLGQAIGRWGNYFNQELYGQPTTAWWGIPIAWENRLYPYNQFTHFQPTFFYESFLNILLFVVLHFLSKIYQDKKGLITWVYLGAYGAIRFVMEFIRIDEEMLLAGWRLPQVLSLVLFCFSLLWIIFRYLKPLPKLKK